MREKFIWAAVAGVLVVGALGWNAITPVNPVANTPPAPRPQPAAASTAPSRPRAAKTPDDMPLAQQIEQLVATHDPEDEYKAYTLISDCAIFNREHDRLIFDIDEVNKHHSPLPYRAMTASEKQHGAQLCTGMTERMRTSRLDYLAAAAKAGVIGAAVREADEGPFGDRTALTTRPDDPLVQQWKAEVRDELSTQAESGDLIALNFLWVRRLTGDELVDQDPALAYRYALAQWLIFKDIDGPESLGATLYAPDSPLLRSISGLSADQRAAELLAAQHIADQARERRHH